MAYRRTARTEARKADTRRRILESARALVADGGFAAVQIAKVARLSGLASGTVYRYFPSKSALCAEVVRSVSEREITVVADIAQSDEPAATRVAKAIGAFASRALRGRRTAYALVVEPVAAAIDSERLVHRRALARVFEDLLADGIAKGEIPPQNQAASAACLVGAVMESLVSPLAPDARRLDDGGAALRNAVVRFCLRALGVEGKAIAAAIIALGDTGRRAA